MIRSKRNELEKKYQQALNKFTFAETWIHMA